jgi:hypothetical protein
MATRHIEIELVQRKVTCVVRMLDDRAPLTCAAIWDALPLSGDVIHAKYARNEIFMLQSQFAESEPPLENPTITPIPGDLVYHAFAKNLLGLPDALGAADGQSIIVALGLFYDRNNLLINGDIGFVPSSVWGTVVRGLEPMAEASNDMWRTGVTGETLLFRRA